MVDSPRRRPPIQPLHVESKPSSEATLVSTDTLQKTPTKTSSETSPLVLTETPSAIHESFGAFIEAPSPVLSENSPSTPPSQPHRLEVVQSAPADIQTPDSITLHNFDRDSVDALAPDPSTWDNIKIWWADNKVLIFYIPRISAVIALLFAPWIFFLSVSQRGALPLPHSSGIKVADNPRSTTHIVVTLSAIVAAAVTHLFGSTLVVITQKWADMPSEYPIHLKVGYLGRIAKIAKLGLIFEFNSLAAFAFTMIAALLFLAGTQLVAGLSAMFTPQPISLTTSLTGSEIDFSATDSTCLDWYGVHPLPTTCGYGNMGNFVFTTCLSENQLFDVAQAGRDIAAFPNSSLPVTFPRMNGTRFLGLFPGVLLPGPNGLNMLSTLSPNDPRAFIDSPTPERSYNYSMTLQGVSTAVTCGYAPSSPLQSIVQNVSIFNESLSGIQWNGTCSNGTSDFLDINNYINMGPNLSLTMGVWACKQDSSNSTFLSYSIYLQGAGTYIPPIQNMTCTMNATLADYTVEYLGDGQYFRTAKGPTPVNQSSDIPNVFVNIFDQVVRHNVDQIMYSQTPYEGNQITEAMLAIGAEYYGMMRQNTTNDSYPGIMASILQGMLNYQAGYLRVIYTGVSGKLPRTLCFREFTGNVTYPRIGWSSSADQFHPSFLAAYTIVLLLSLFLYVVALEIPVPYDGWNPVNPTDVAAAGLKKRLIFTKPKRKEDVKEDFFKRKPRSDEEYKPLLGGSGQA